MATETVIAYYVDAIEHLPDGGTLTFHNVGWDDYEGLLEHLGDRAHRRVSYDCGKLEVMTPLSEHERHTRFIDSVVRVVSEELGLTLEPLGSTTWKRRD